METLYSSPSILSVLDNLDAILLDRKPGFGTTPRVMGSATPRTNVRMGAGGSTATYEIALPGYDRSDLEVRLLSEHIEVRSSAQKDYGEYLVASARVLPFKLTFYTGPGAKVTKATMSNGLLVVEMSREETDNTTRVTVTDC